MAGRSLPFGSFLSEPSSLQSLSITTGESVRVGAATSGSTYNEALNINTSLYTTSINTIIGSSSTTLNIISETSLSSYLSLNEISILSTNLSSASISSFIIEDSITLNNNTSLEIDNSILVFGSNTVSFVGGVLTYQNSVLDNVLPLNYNTAISSSSEIVIEGAIEVSCTIQSSNGLFSESQLITVDNLVLPMNLLDSKMSNTSIASEISLNLLKYLEDTGGLVVDDSSFISTLFETTANKTLVLSGDITLSASTTSNVSSTLQCISNTTLSISLLQELISTLVNNSNITLDYQVDMIYIGRNPALQIRTTSEEIILLIDDRNLLVSSTGTNLFLSKNKI